MREENEERPEPVVCFRARMRLGVVYGREKGERRLETLLPTLLSGLACGRGVGGVLRE